MFKVNNNYYISCWCLHGIELLYEPESRKEEERRYDQAAASTSMVMDWWSIELEPIKYPSDFKLQTKHGLIKIRDRWAYNGPVV